MERNRAVKEDSKPPAATALSAAEEEFAFRFDTRLEPVVLGGEIDLSGWLFRRDDKPIQGIRAVVRRRFHRARIVRGRRKRKRPEVAATFPDLATAAASGFLLELRLRLGRNHLTFQVLDHDRVWRTFAAATVSALPLAFLKRSGLTNVRRFLIFYLGQFLRSRNAQWQSNVPPAPRAPVLPAARPRTQRVDLFATTKSNLFIIEIGELVAAGFRELGCSAQLHLDRVPLENPPDDTIQIVVTPHEFYNLFLSQQFTRRRLRELTRGVHLLCTEQPETGWFQSNLQWGVFARGVADINPLGVAAYRERGFESHHLQLGYHPILAHPEKIPHAERTIDLTFLGSLTERRDEFFARHADFFARHRCHLRLVPLGFAKTEKTRSYLTVERRNELLSRSRILLNLHYSEQKYFEWHRMLVGLANGCCIITETCQGYGALIPGKHFIMVDAEYLIPACEYYLAHPEECAEIARAGLEFIETELRQAQTCAAFLREIEAKEQTSPAAMALDAAEAPLPSGLAHRIAQHTGRLLFRAIKRDAVAGISVITERIQPPRPPIADASVPDARVRQEVIAKREAYAARLREQEEARGRGEAVSHVHDNRALTAGGTPKLSVLITLYNYAQHIEECVASVAVAATRLQEPPEIVIVNDASTDDSLGRALQLQRASRLAIRVVDKRWNTGLADARNTALRIARAPHVFMMDADNLVFPEALSQLLAAITTEKAAAAYSLLCRFRKKAANRIGLLSYFDWDPEILSQYPYIDAMAMFDRKLLLDLGGYDNQLSQIGWFGWEDYDMWLRIAQHEERVAFVPNILCLYRHHEKSMINTTNLFETELVHHLLEHYGELLERFEPRAKVFGVEREKIAEFRARQPAAESLPASGWAGTAD
ncbi:MAG TPA: glycosyltransferase [Chthoniobacterales bacterium]|nr:glycosyltransferase [Chthoniobacterales bacterium]